MIICFCFGSFKVFYFGLYSHLSCVQYLKMKRINALILFFGFLAIGISCQPSRNLSRGWQFEWEENFNQTTHIDSAIWSKIPRGTPDWMNYMSDFDSCYDMQNGNLVLFGIVNKPEYNLNDTATYLTGGVYTKDKKAFHNGRLEIRARIAGARGAWPAIWLLPQNGTWPDGGEIDIMERLHSESIAYQTVHSYYTVRLKQNTPPKGGTGPIDADGYNTYAVELGVDSLRFFINDVHTFTYPKIETDQEGQYPFDQPYYLLIDMQLGGSWVGRVYQEDLPAEMWVDWIRFYTKR